MVCNNEVKQSAKSKRSKTDRTNKIKDVKTNNESDKDLDKIKIDQEKETGDNRAYSPEKIDNMKQVGKVVISSVEIDDHCYEEIVEDNHSKTRDGRRNLPKPAVRGSKSGSLSVKNNYINDDGYYEIITADNNIIVAKINKIDDIYSNISFANISGAHFSGKSSEEIKLEKSKEEIELEGQKLVEDQNSNLVNISIADDDKCDNDYDNLPDEIDDSSTQGNVSYDENIQRTVYYIDEDLDEHDGSNSTENAAGSFPIHSSEKEDDEFQLEPTESVDCGALSFKIWNNALPSSKGCTLTSHPIKYFNDVTHDHSVSTISRQPSSSNKTYESISSVAISHQPSSVKAERVCTVTQHLPSHSHEPLNSLDLLMGVSEDTSHDSDLCYLRDEEVDYTLVRRHVCCIASSSKEEQQNADSCFDCPVHYLSRPPVPVPGEEINTDANRDGVVSCENDIPHFKDNMPNVHEDELSISSLCSTTSVNDNMVSHYKDEVPIDNTSPDFKLYTPLQYTNAPNHSFVPNNTGSTVPNSNTKKYTKVKSKPCTSPTNNESNAEETENVSSYGMIFSMYSVSPPKYATASPKRNTEPKYTLQAPHYYARGSSYSAMSSKFGASVLVNNPVYSSISVDPLHCVPLEYPILSFSRSYDDLNASSSSYSKNKSHTLKRNNSKGRVSFKQNNEQREIIEYESGRSSSSKSILRKESSSTISSDRHDLSPYELPMKQKKTNGKKVKNGDHSRLLKELRLRMEKDHQQLKYLQKERKDPQYILDDYDQQDLQNEIESLEQSIIARGEQLVKLETIQERIRVDPTYPHTRSSLPSILSLESLMRNCFNNNYSSTLNEKTRSEPQLLFRDDNDEFSDHRDKNDYEPEKLYENFKKYQQENIREVDTNYGSHYNLYGKEDMLNGYDFLDKQSSVCSNLEDSCSVKSCEDRSIIVSSDNCQSNDLIEELNKLRTELYKAEAIIDAKLDKLENSTALIDNDSCPSVCSLYPEEEPVEMKECCSRGKKLQQSSSSIAHRDRNYNDDKKKEKRSRKVRSPPSSFYQDEMWRNSTPPSEVMMELLRLKEQLENAENYLERKLTSLDSREKIYIG